MANTKSVRFVVAVIILVGGGVGRATASLTITGTSVTVNEGGTGTFSFNVTNNGANTVDFTNFTGSISSLTGDANDFGSAPFVINTFSVNPGATVVFPFQVVTGAADPVGEPIDFGVSGFNLSVTGKERVTNTIFTVSADSFITVNDSPATPAAATVPEPSTLAAAAVACLIGLGYARRRGNRRFQPREILGMR